MKILYFNDSHIRGVNSAHRLGNYYEDCLLKLDETIKLSQGCDIVICGGDLVDVHTVSNGIVDDILDKIEMVGINWYVTLGNHDLLNGHIKNSKSTSLAHMFRRSKLVKPLDELKDDNIYIKGYHYYYEIEKDFKENGLMHDQKDKYTIAVPHAFVSIKPFMSEVLHVVAKDIKTNYDLVLCSHFHNDTGITEINKTKFLNMGAIGRLSITEASHQPKVAIIDTETKDIEIIPLKSAKMGSEIFDLSKVKEVKAFNDNMKKFILSLESTEFQEMNIKGMISNIAKENKVDAEVINLIMNKFEEFDDGD